MKWSLFAIVLLFLSTTCNAGNRDVVDAWLKENLDSGEYEVVKWLEDVPVKGALVWDLESVQDYRQTRTRATTFWKPLDQGGRALRLKYRSTNALGGKVLADEVFLINDAGEIYGVISSLDFRLPKESIAAWQKRMNFKTPKSDAGQKAWMDLLDGGLK